MAAKKKVTGIGGIFIKCDSPEKMREWYGNQLGLVINDFGAMFEFKTADEPSKPAYSLWSTFPKTSKYFDKEYMINFRVEDIEGLVEELKKNNVTVIDNIENSEYGKFVHILDLEGNKLELWEPLD
jgi:predicted enzyme related to lactoylglutathione lyase